MLTTIPMLVWVHIEQELPKLGEDVLVLTRDGREMLGFWGVDGRWWTSELPLVTLDVVAWRAYSDVAVVA